MSNWDDYRFLLALEDADSFAAAARSLGVSQPTVRRRLLDLEKHLDIKLLERTPEGHRLSEQGKRICDQARRLVEQTQFIELAARGVRDQSMSRVRVTASEGLAYVVLTPVIARMRRRNPEVAIDLLISNRAADLLRHEADLAVRLGDPKDEQLIGRRVGEVTFGLYASDDYLAGAPSLNTAKDLGRHEIIESTGEIAQLPQVVWLRDNASQSLVRYSSNSLLNQLHAVRHGLGLLAMPTYLAADVMNIRRVLAKEFNISICAWLLTNAQSKTNPAVRAVIDLMVDELIKHFLRVEQHCERS